MTSIVASANDNFEKRSNKSFKTVQRENLDQNEIIDVRPKNVEQQKKSVDEEHWEKRMERKSRKTSSLVKRKSWLRRPVKSRTRGSTPKDRYITASYIEPVPFINWTRLVCSKYTDFRLVTYKPNPS